MSYHGKALIQTSFYCIISFIFLQIIYIHTIYPRYAYYGFGGEFSLTRYVIAWIMFMPIPFFINHFASKTKEVISAQIVCLVLITIYLPSLILYIYMDTPFILYLFIYYMIFALSAEFIPGIEFTRIVFKKSQIRLIINFIGFFFSLIVIFVWVYYTRCRIQIGFSTVYSARIEARNFSMPILLNYLRAMARGIIPLLAIYNLYLKRIKHFIIYVIVQFIQFSIDGSKSVFFLMFLGIVSYYILARYSVFIKLIPKMIALGSAVALLENILLKTSVITNLLIRRIMFIPALLNYQFYEYFSQNGFDWYKQSLSFLGSSKYNVQLAKVVGDVYYAGTNTNANNGLFSDAYANLGVIGCFLMPIAIVLVFKLMEGVGEKIPQSIWSISAIHAYFSFTGSSFFTVLLTHGVILEIIMLYLIKNSISQHKNSC